MKIILIDNYDSFTYNLVQYIEEVPGVQLTVVKNDQVTEDHLHEAERMVISPGPGIPSGNGKIIGLVKKYSGHKPILGVCLGLQAIYEAFGGSLINLPQVFHGVSSNVRVIEDDQLLFTGISNPFAAGRYHSWVCDPANIPGALLVIAYDEDNEIMACRHRDHPTYGVQFHPESFLTPEGKRLIKNFIELA